MGRKVQVQATKYQRHVMSELFFNPDIVEAAMLGARGTVKTHAGCLISQVYLGMNPGEVGVAFRKTEKATEENIGAPFERIAAEMGVPWRYLKNKSEYIHPNGSVFRIRHCAS